MKANFLYWSLHAVLFVFADVPFEPCPVVSGTANFDVTQYLGTWYHLATPPAYSSYYRTRCSIAIYELLPSGNIRTRKSSVKISTNTRTWYTSELALVQNRTGEWSMSYYTTPSPTDEPNIFVLDTDNTEYSYLWYCYNNVPEMYHVPYLWIMNRDSDRTTEYIEQQKENAFAVLESFNYSSVSIERLRDRVSVKDHDDCGDYGVG